MAAITTRKIEAVVHTKIDAARRRTVAKTIALDRLSAFLGDAAPALQPPALPWVDLEIRPAFREPVEICVDCPEKATNGPAFKVRFPRLVRCLRLVCSMASSGRRRVDGVNDRRRWRESGVGERAEARRSAVYELPERSYVSMALDRQGYKTQKKRHVDGVERNTQTRQKKQNTGPGPARARGGLARGAKGRSKKFRPRPRPRRGRRRGGARKSFGAVRARRHVGAARGLGRAAAPQGVQGLARLRRPAASKIHQARESRRWRGAQYFRESWNIYAMA